MFYDVIETLYTQGKIIASEKFSHMYFTIASTPEKMKLLGVEGERFTISYGTISRHYDKDSAHYLPKEVWIKLPDAIVKPFAISKYFSESEHINMKGYRLYTVIQYEEGCIVVGVTVKSQLYIYNFCKREESIWQRGCYLHRNKNNSLTGSTS